MSALGSPKRLEKRAHPCCLVSLNAITQVGLWFAPQSDSISLSPKLLFHTVSSFFLPPPSPLVTSLCISLGKWIELPRSPSTILLVLVPAYSALLPVIRPSWDQPLWGSLDLLLSWPPKCFTLAFLSTLSCIIPINMHRRLLPEKQTQPNSKPPLPPATTSLFSFRAKVLKRFVSLSLLPLLPFSLGHT